jgi:type II restriction enzyme
MESILQNAIRSAQESEIAYSKFITPNDTGKTGGHQAGYHIHKSAWPLFFTKSGEKGSNTDVWVTIKWQDDFETQSRFIYYGSKSRNEYRLTNFGRKFPFLSGDNLGDLLIICKKEEKYYEAFVLQTDDDIEDFFTGLNLSANETNRIIPKQFQLTAEDRLYNCFITFLRSLTSDFPSTFDLSSNARRCYDHAYSITPKAIQKNPDQKLLNWLDAEFQLFKTIENDRYSTRIKTPFSTVEELVEIANTILNRRKSRAGKSLEHHLKEIFNIFKLAFESQVLTEDNKKPDFLFPNRASYCNPKFNEKKLLVLASKTTCKDRWRQVLNEADRIKIKHLFTLQQGISINQLDEMYKYNVHLVIPKSYLHCFPKQYHNKILTLDKFIKQVQKTQS